MKGKTHLVLLEQIVMLAVFALAAALCLRAFALADRLSRENMVRDRAVLLAQNTAEVCRSGRGDTAFLMEKLGGEGSAQSWKAFCGEDLSIVEDSDQPVYRVAVLHEESKKPGLGRAEVSVYMAEDGRLLVKLPVAWQEEVKKDG